MTYGAENALWAPMNDEGDEETKPTYGTTTEIDGIYSNEDSLSMAEASAYGDNMEKIYINEFTSGDITMEAVEITPDLYGKIMGSEVDDEGGITHAVDDEQPYGGYGFLEQLMTAGNKKYHRVVFYPKVKGVKPDSTTSNTKEDSISLEYEDLNMRVLAVEYNNVYKITKRFEVENEARDYLKGLFAGTAEWPGLPKA